MKVKSLLLIAALGVSMSVFAQDAQPGIPTTDHLYFKGNVNQEDGTSTLEYINNSNEEVVTLYLEDIAIKELIGGKTYGDFQVDFTVPEGFAVETNSRGKLVATPLDRLVSDSHKIEFAQSSSNPLQYRLLAYSGDGYEMTGDNEDKGINDPICSFKLIAEESAIQGKGKVGDITIFAQQLTDPVNKGAIFFFHGTGGQGVAPRVETEFKLGVFGTTAVTELAADKAVAGVKYFNAAGLESNEPFQGVNIVVTKYVDGTTKAVKVVK
ncbi:MAG: hypothetical protein IJ632_01555 [Muribaculaceae bacterium]|nr:hypothetical protein [Muribaculaceae bacterium]